jgi:hypothetical protein
MRRRSFFFRFTANRAFSPFVFDMTAVYPRISGGG